MSQIRVPTNPATFQMVGNKLDPDATEQELREEYAAFVEDIKRDLTAIEAECGGVPTFTEWKLAYRENPNA
jgi:hypothetical protein